MSMCAVSRGFGLYSIAFAFFEWSIRKQQERCTSYDGLCWSSVLRSSGTVRNANHSLLSPSSAAAAPSADVEHPPGATIFVTEQGGKEGRPALYATIFGLYTTYQTEREYFDSFLRCAKSDSSLNLDGIMVPKYYWRTGGDENVFGLQLDRHCFRNIHLPSRLLSPWRSVLPITISYGIMCSRWHPHRDILPNM